MECSMGPRHTSGLSPGTEEADGNHFQAITLGRQNAVFANYAGRHGGAQHQGNVGAVDVGIKQPDLVAHAG